MKYYINGYEYNSNKFNFPAGEVNVSLSKDATPPVDKNVVIDFKYNSDSDVVELMMLHDAIKREYKPKSTKLLCHYLPYARQDRVCNKGEAHSLKVFCNLINSMKFDEVQVVDCHSDVGTALLDNVVHIDIKSLFNNIELFNTYSNGSFVLVSPDAGAEKKVRSLAKFLQCDMIRFTKERDLQTGEIKSITAVDDIPKEAKFLVVDDIIDGGGTFIPIAQQLRLRTTNKLHLFCTHGVFSKGAKHLLDYYDKLLTTDSICKEKESDKIKIIKL